MAETGICGVNFYPAYKLAELSKREKEMYDVLYDAMEELRCAAYGYTENANEMADKILAFLKHIDHDI